MSIVSCKPTITRKELEGVLDCLINDELLTGDAVKLFEKNLSDLLSIKYSLAVNSLTAAYHLAFKAIGIDENSEVIIPAYFNPAPLNALEMCGGKAVFVDIADQSLIPAAEDIKNAVTDNTKAVVCGHVSGIAENFEAVKELGIPLIEDISHAIGCEADEKPVGSSGAITITSFTPFDIITTGNGAAVSTTNTKYYSTMKKLRYSSDETSYEYTMTDFQGAMGISQLFRIQDFLRRRREIAGVYYERIRLTQHKALYSYNPSYAYQSFPVFFDSPDDKVRKYFKKNGIEVFNSVSTPLHVMKGYKPLDFPRSDRMSKKLYSLPIYPTLTRKEIEKIARNLAKFI